MIINIRATNSLGDTFLFGDDARIVTGFDVSGLSADVNYTETNRNGSRYQNTVLNNRELALEVQLRKNFNNEIIMDAVRQNMYRVFTPELNPIRFDFETSNGEQFYLTAYALNAPIMRPDKDNYNAAFQRMLLQFTCTDPYIYQNLEARGISPEIDLAGYEGGLEFDWEIPEEGDEFETRITSLNSEIDFPGTGIDGMIIKFKASGGVIKPKLTNAYTNQYIEINSEMSFGDQIEVSTYQGQRSVTLIRGGVRTNIFSQLSLPGSTFLQLQPGTNVFIYGAESGIDFLDISLEYRIRRIGV